MNVTRQDKHNAFEWLRSVALGDDPAATHAAILMTEVSKAAPAERLEFGPNNVLRVVRDQAPTLSLAGCPPVLYGSGGVSGSLGPSFVVHIDPDMPDDVMEFRDRITGRVLARITNVGK